MSRLRIGIVGCGAVVERFHLPASVFTPEISIVSLVDRDRSRAEKLASIYRIEGVADDFRDIIGKVDAAIVALPHDANAHVSRELLKNGISILVEKPLALAAGEARELGMLAKASKASLTVGYTRRCGNGVGFIRSVLRENAIGTVTGFSVEDGYLFDWQSAGAEFRLSRAGGGGVLLDVGCHVLDMVLFWFGGATIVSARHDAVGGIEVNAFANLQTPGGARGTVELSWERPLRNSAVIEGTAGRLEVEWYRNSACAYLSGNVIRGVVTPEGSPHEKQNFDMMFVEQLREWAKALRGDRERVLATAADAASVLELVEIWRARGNGSESQWGSPDLEELFDDA